MRQKLHIADWAAVITMIVAVLILLGLAYAVFVHDRVPVEFENMPFYVPADTIDAGAGVWTRIEGCKHTTAPGTTSRILVGESISYPLPSQPADTPAGCFEIWVQIAQIPHNVEPGRYHVEGATSYQVNPLANRSVSWHTEEFVVVAADED